MLQCLDETILSGSGKVQSLPCRPISKAPPSADL
jgi:hypothetical protein